MVKRVASKILKNWKSTIRKRMCKVAKSGENKSFMIDLKVDK